MEFSTVKISDKGQISIPAKMREKAGLKKGDTLIIVGEGKKITLESASEIERRLNVLKKSVTLLASEKSLAKDWLSKEEDEAWKNL